MDMSTIYAKYLYFMCFNISSAFLHLNMCLKRHCRLTETFHWSPRQQMSYSPRLLEAVFLICISTLHSLSHIVDYNMVS